MPPNDDILGSETTPTTPEATASPGGVSLEQVSQLVRESQETLMRSLDSRFGQLAESLRPTPAPTTPAGSDDFLKGFAENPEGAIEVVVGRTVSPIINQLTTSAGKAFVDLEAQRVDADWGAGAWDKFIRPHWSKLEAAYLKNNPTALSNRDHVAREVYSLVGMQAKDLQSHKAAADKAAADSKGKDVDTLVETVTQRVGLTGGLRPANIREGELPPEAVQSVSSYIDRKVRALGGDRPDPKSWVKETIFEGDTVDHYIAHQASLKSKGAH